MLLKISWRARERPRRLIRVASGSSLTNGVPGSGSTPHPRPNGDECPPTIAASLGPDDGSGFQTPFRAVRDPLALGHRWVGLGPDETIGCRQADRAFWLVMLLSMLPMVVASVTAFVATGPSRGDVAVFEMTVSNILTDPPLTGPYALHLPGQAYHLGPAAYYLLAAPYWVLGRTGPALSAAAILLHSLSIAAAGVLARRRLGSEYAIATLLLISILFHGSGPSVYTLAWLPYLPMSAVIVLVLAAWSVAESDLAAMPIVVISGTIVIQTHMGYSIVGFTAVAFACWAFLRTKVSTDKARRSRRRSILLSIALGATLWAPVVIQEVTQPAGNVSAVASAAAGTSPTLGLGRATIATVFELGPSAGWLKGWSSGPSLLGVGADPLQLVPLGLIALVVAFVAATCAGRGSIRHLTFLLALLLLVAWLSVAQVFGVPYRYVAAVLMPLSMMMWLPLFGVVTPAIRRSRGLLGALIACAMVVALASTLDAAHPDRGVVATGVEIDRASDLIIRALGDSSTPVLVDFDNSFDAAPYQPGLIAELRNRGVRAV